MTKLYLPPDVMSTLPKNIVDDFILLQDDIGDITVGYDKKNKELLGMGHIIDGKFILYSFDDPRKEAAIREIESEYKKEFSQFEDHMKWRSDNILDFTFDEDD